MEICRRSGDSVRASRQLIRAGRDAARGCQDRAVFPGKARRYGFRARFDGLQSGIDALSLIVFQRALHERCALIQSVHPGGQVGDGGLKLGQSARQAVGPCLRGDQPLGKRCRAIRQLLRSGVCLRRAVRKGGRPLGSRCGPSRQSGSIVIERLHARVQCFRAGGHLTCAACQRICPVRECSCSIRQLAHAAGESFRAGFQIRCAVVELRDAVRKLRRSARQLLYAVVQVTRSVHQLRGGVRQFVHGVRQVVKRVYIVQIQRRKRVV